jgi:hypothetical protein
MKYRNQLLTALIATCLLATNASYADNDGHDHSAHAECKHDHSSEHKHEHKEESHAGHGHEAHDGHEHDEHAEHDHHEKQAGPNGGRVITSVEPHLEFFVTEDGFVQITFFNEDDEILAPKEQTVSLIGGDRQNPVRLRFKMKGKVLLSTEALPEGNNLPMILSIKPNKTSKTVREKFTLNLSDCPTCDYKEYACTCAHGEAGHEGHDH